MRVTDIQILNSSPKPYTLNPGLLVEASVDLDVSDNEGITALMTASKQGNVEIVRLLLLRGFRV